MDRLTTSLSMSKRRSTPSRNAPQKSAALRNAAQIVGLPLLDHIIVTDIDYFSFRSEEGWE